ncbi:MAG: TonB-dependent receptor [Bryobacteraceae bacterium]|nr:TonB-dependent receptor [Bryobacteraceae bacterium]
MRFTPKSVSFLAALLTGLAVPAYPQTGTGVVRGTVYDTARAAVPSAKVVLTQLTTGVARETSSNELGLYLFAGAPPGRYRLSIEYRGFKTWSTEFLLQAGQTAVLEPVLEVGSVDTIVEVTGAAPVINMESSELGDVKDSIRIQQLPLNGRSITNLFDLTAGVEGGGNPRINGLKVGSAEMTLDGVSLVDRFGGGMARVQPGLDIVQEFRIETVGSGAQFSRPGTITMVTKSGTNQFHGTMFETFRNNGAGLVSRRRQDGNTAAFLARNEFGASAGGPILIPKVYDGRNKSFWFFAYEGLRTRSRSFYQARVPTDAMWEGDFSNIIDSAGRRTTIYDPLTTGANGTRLPFIGNTIPKARFNPIFGTFREVTHAATESANPYLDVNMREFYPVRNDTDNITVRGDHNFTAADVLSLRYTRSTRTYRQNGGVFGAPRADISDGFGTGRQDSKVHNVSLRYTKTITPALLSELLLGVHRAPKDSGTNADFTDWPARLGLPNPLGELGWPSVSAGIFGWDSDNYKPEKLTAYILQENMTWIRGRHTLKFGGQFRQEQNNIMERQQAQGSHSFAGGWTAQFAPASDNAVPFTGDGFASMALGLPGSLTNNFNRGYFYFRQKELGLYIQDSWKITSRLTLDLGLRWDNWTPYREKQDRLVNVDPRSVASVWQVVTPRNVRMEDIRGVLPSTLASWAHRGLTWKTAEEAGLPPALLPADNNNFGPRLGFAYKLTGKTVIRGGYGEFFWTMPLSQILQASRINPPFNLRYTNPIANLDGSASFALRTAPLPGYFVGRATVDTGGLVTIPVNAQAFAPWDPFNWRDGRAQSWHFTIERELMTETKLRITYTGNHGRDLEQKFSINERGAEYNYVARTGAVPPANRDLMRANKDWALPNATNKTGYSNTNSIQTEVERRFSHGLAFQWFHVFTRAMTTTDAGGFTSGNAGINATNGTNKVPQNEEILGNPQMTYDQRLRLVYQNSATVPAHQIRWNGIYDLPFGKGRKFASGTSRFVDAFIGGWQSAVIGQWRGGYWMGVNAARYLFGDPRLTEDQRLEMDFAGRPRRLWFAGDFNPTLATNVDQNALQKLVPLNQADRVLRPLGPGLNNQLPQTLANGTVRSTPITDSVNWNSRAFYKGPGAWGSDISVMKNFTFSERIKLRFSADLFNAFNHPNDANPDTTTGLQDLTVQTNEPRTIQFSLRLIW